jgi:hypothetical protein
MLTTNEYLVFHFLCLRISLPKLFELCLLEFVLNESLALLSLTLIFVELMDVRGFPKFLSK